VWVCLWSDYEIIINNTWIIFCFRAEHDMKINIFDKEHGVMRMTVPAKSLHTMIYK
jgi:hypothetical protein